MELVYLWVEKYKNIEKQGFNFSPRFICSYDDDTNNLEIIDKEETGEDYPKNFFGDNINVTAIVGENGSGKSSILEAFTDSLSENSSKLLNEEQYRKYIVIYKYKTKYYYLLKHISETIELLDNQKNKIQWIEKNPNERLLSWHNDILTLIIENETKPRKIFYNDKQVIVEQVQSDKNNTKKLIITNLMQNPIFKKDANKFFNPTQVQIKIKWNHLFHKREDADIYKKEILDEIEVKIKEAKESFKNNKNQDGFLKIFEICNLKQA
ncbi:MAG: AAA family ATPase, partial [Thiovulaceae bacterium]|nr:AAA family ATPase [Sulfurimonadaceae bacterium]